MTIRVKDASALAEWLRLLAEQIEAGKVHAVSIEYEIDRDYRVTAVSRADIPPLMLPGVRKDDDEDWADEETKK